jgi:hypothetical protein
MSKGLGHIERAIQHAIERSDAIGGVMPVLVSSWGLCFDVFNRPATLGYVPTTAQRKAVVRAMHSFVRKKQQYALTGGQGRRDLFLYEPDDPMSAMRAKMTVERKSGTNPPSIYEVRAALGNFGRPSASRAGAR